MLSKKRFVADVSYVFHNVYWKPQKHAWVFEVYQRTFSMKDNLNPMWISALGLIQTKFNWDAIESALENERNRFRCFPEAGKELKAFENLNPEQVKVVICGQDPYHQLGQAHGLAFSVGPGIDWPPSLRNIVREFESDLERPWPLSSSGMGQGALDHWVDQGVLLLNDVLTVREGDAGSHRNLGWQAFTSGVFKVICQQPQPIVFILWGKEAQKKASLVCQPHHLVLQASHPSPLSAYRDFFGSKPFSKANAWFVQHGSAAIGW